MITGHIVYRLIDYADRTVGFLVLINGKRHVVIRDWWDIKNLYICGVDFDNATVDTRKKVFTTDDNDLESLNLHGYHWKLGSADRQLYETYKIAKKIIQNEIKHWNKAKTYFKGIEQISQSIIINIDTFSNHTYYTHKIHITILDVETNKQMLQYTTMDENDKVIKHWTYDKDIKSGIKMALFEILEFE